MKLTTFDLFIYIYLYLYLSISISIYISLSLYIYLSLYYVPQAFDLSPISRPMLLLSLLFASSESYEMIVAKEKNKV